MSWRFWNRAIDDLRLYHYSYKSLTWVVTDADYFKVIPSLSFRVAGVRF